MLSFIYENRMEPVEIVPRRGEGRRENNARDKSKIQCKDMCKYHSVSIPCATAVC
jgi:hypothetical protein